MSQGASISQVYKEVRAIRKILEELSEKALLQSLATEPISKGESRELDKAFEKVRRGKFVTLQKVKRR